MDACISSSPSNNQKIPCYSSLKAWFLARHDKEDLMRHIITIIKLPYGWCSLLQLFTRLVPSPQNLSRPRPTTLPHPPPSSNTPPYPLPHTHTQPLSLSILGSLQSCFVGPTFVVVMDVVLKFTMEYTTFKGTLTPTLQIVVFSLVDHKFHKLNLPVLSVNLRKIF